MHRRRKAVTTRRPVARRRIVAKRRIIARRGIPRRPVVKRRVPRRAVARRNLILPPIEYDKYVAVYDCIELGKEFKLQTQVLRAIYETDVYVEGLGTRPVIAYEGMITAYVDKGLF